MRQRWTGLLFVLPALLPLGLFKFYPMAQAFLLSFFKYDLLNPPIPSGLANYRALYESPSAVDPGFPASRVSLACTLARNLPTPGGIVAVCPGRLSGPGAKVLGRHSRSPLTCCTPPFNPAVRYNILSRAP